LQEEAKNCAWRDKYRHEYPQARKEASLWEPLRPQLMESLHN